MTKALSKFPEAERDAVAKRRVSRKTEGLGYISALAYLENKKKKK